MNTQQGFVSAGILIAIVLGLIVVGGGAYFVIQQNSAPQTTSEIDRLDTSQPAPTTPTTNNPTQQIQATTDAASTYTDSGFGFSFWYPSNWQVKNSTGANSDFEVQGGQGGSVVGILRISNPGVTFTVEKILSPSMTLTGPPFSTDSQNFFTMYAYNASTRVWTKNGSNITADLTTLDGLPVVKVASPNFKGLFEWLIPLSGGNFIVVYDSGTATTNTSAENFIKTISAVGASISTAQQSSAVQAMLAAYGGL